MLRSDARYKRPHDRSTKATYSSRSPLARLHAGRFVDKVGFPFRHIVDAKALTNTFQGDELNHVTVRVVEINLPSLKHPLSPVLFEENLYAVGSQLGNSVSVCIHVDAE